MNFKKTGRGWRVDFYHPLTKERIRQVLPARTLTEAKTMFEMRRKEMLAGEGFLPRQVQDSLPLSEAIKSYLAEYSSLYKSLSAHETDKFALNGLLEVAGDIPLLRLTTGHIASYIQREHSERELMANSVNRRLNSIKHFLSWCYERGWLTSEIGRKVKHIRGPSRECRPLANGEIEKVYEHGTPLLRLQILISATWGLRAGEVASLEWSWVDFENDVVSIGKTASFSTKSGKSKTLPVPMRLKQALLDRRQEVQGSKWVFPNQWGTGPMKGHVISTAWRRARLKAGLEYVRFHDLRATVGTRLAEQGYGDASVARVLGHGSPNMARHYSKHVVAPIRSGIALIENSLPENLFGQSTGRVSESGETV